MRGSVIDLRSERPDVMAALYSRLKEICRDESSGLPFDVRVTAGGRTGRSAGQDVIRESGAVGE
ncbi:hypothetical protein GCM10010199_07870 [Dactylosporangium roseum]